MNCYDTILERWKWNARQTLVMCPLIWAVIENFKTPFLLMLWVVDKHTMFDKLISRVGLDNNVWKINDEK